MTEDDNADLEAGRDIEKVTEDDSPDFEIGVDSRATSEPRHDLERLVSLWFQSCTKVTFMKFNLTWKIQSCREEESKIFREAEEQEKRHPDP